MTAWSYSSIKTFEQCPKKYYHLRVAKDVKDEGGPAAQYGTDLHAAAENFIKSGTPVPSQFAFMKPILDSLSAIPGEKHTELRLGVKLTDDGYAPCDFFAPDVWWRGVADLVIINGNRAKSVDYKSGKNVRYADPKQLDLVAGALFVHFPKLERIDSALIYVASNDLITKQHVITERATYLNTFNAALDRLNSAYDTGVWNAVSTPLCGWCPVSDCEHHYVPRKR